MASQETCETMIQSQDGLAIHCDQILVHSTPLCLFIASKRTSSKDDGASTTKEIRDSVSAAYPGYNQKPILSIGSRSMFLNFSAAHDTSSVMSDTKPATERITRFVCLKGPEWVRSSDQFSQEYSFLGPEPLPYTVKCLVNDNEIKPASVNPHGLGTGYGQKFHVITDPAFATYQVVGHSSYIETIVNMV